MDAEATPAMADQEKVGEALGSVQSFVAGSSQLASRSSLVSFPAVLVVRVSTDCPEDSLVVNASVQTARIRRVARRCMTTVFQEMRQH